MIYVRFTANKYIISKVYSKFFYLKIKAKLTKFALPKHK